MFVVRLSESAGMVILEEARASSDGTETGGILLGHDRGDGSIEVTVAGAPGPHALRTANRFTRDLAHAEALADAAYEEDGSVWVGEWHTHPKGPPEPSDVDLRTYLSHLSDSRLGFERFVCLIALPCPEHAWEHISLTAWIVYDHVVEVAELRMEAEP
jgi:integrative and conjugative element protein (TIGR02256 family)